MADKNYRSVKKDLFASASKTDTHDKKKAGKWVAATPKSPSKGKNVMATENSRSANKDMTQTSKSSYDKNVPKEMEAPVKTTAGVLPSC